MWIKICGNTNLEDARLAVQAGADALGFVFAPSPRQMTVLQVRQITAQLPPEIETYGVFVDADFHQIVAAVESCGLHGVQLHGAGDSGRSGLRFRLHEHFARLGHGLKIIPVMRWANAESKVQGDAAPALRASLNEYNRDPAVHAVLVDSFSAKAAGGTGSSFDWAQARHVLLKADPGLRIIVAGGLRPENVKEAISTLRPWGVDVVSGVEAAPGRKDPVRLRAFIQAARNRAPREAGDDLDNLQAAGGRPKSKETRQ
jgi:phosphoribosylanthranilate isomerase